MYFVELAFVAEVLDLLAAQPMHRFYLFLLQAQHFDGDVALEHVKEGEFIPVPADPQEFQFALGDAEAEFLLEFALHGNGEVHLARLHVTGGGGVVASFRLGYLLNQVFAFVVVDKHGHNGDHQSLGNHLSAFHSLTGGPQVVVV